MMGVKTKQCPMFDPVADTNDDLSEASETTAEGHDFQISKNSHGGFLFPTIRLFAILFLASITSKMLDRGSKSSLFEEEASKANKLSFTPDLIWKSFVWTYPPNEFLNCPENLMWDARATEVDGSKTISVASDDIYNVLNNLGRTEDVALSPDGKRLAIARFEDHKVLMLRFRFFQDSLNILTADTISVEEHIREPHGLSFLDDSSIIIGNRAGNVSVLILDSAEGVKAVASNVLVDGGYYPAPARFPGNVGVRQISGSSMVEVTIGMTYVGKVGRYILDRDNKDGDWSVIYGETLLSGGMTLPDANAISISGDWIAVSDPNEHAVLIYRNTGELNALTEPSGVLKGVRSPHGLVFLADDRFLLVNDASYPYVYTYEAPFADWTGHRTPIKSTRVMNDETFFCNAFNSEEGGPKGMELLQDHDVLVLTSHCQPMAVFGLDHFGVHTGHIKGFSTDHFSSSGHEVDTILRRMGRRQQILHLQNWELQRGNDNGRRMDKNETEDGGCQNLLCEHKAAREHRVKELRGSIKRLEVQLKKPSDTDKQLSRQNRLNSYKAQLFDLLEPMSEEELQAFINF